MSIDTLRYYVGLPYNTMIIIEEENNSHEDSSKEVKIYKINTVNTFDFENLLSNVGDACRNYKQDYCFCVADVLHEKENPPEA